MHKLWFLGMTLLLGALTGCAQTAPTDGPTEPLDREGDLQVGDSAPDFTLTELEGKLPVTLSRLTGKPVVLYFGSCT